MNEINLIGRKKQQERKNNWITIGVIAVFVGFCLYFIGISAFTLVKTIYLTQSLSKISKESQSISASILKNNTKLNSYVLSKEILTKIENIRSGRFLYKDYVDNVVTLLPEGVNLNSVDFSKKGTVQVGVKFDNSLALKTFEDDFADGKSAGNLYFDSVIVNSLSRLESTGQYDAKLVFQIAKSNGK